MLTRNVWTDWATVVSAVYWQCSPAPGSVYQTASRQCSGFCSLGSWLVTSTSLLTQTRLYDLYDGRHALPSPPHPAHWDHVCPYLNPRTLFNEKSSDSLDGPVPIRKKLIPFIRLVLFPAERTIHLIGLSMLLLVLPRHYRAVTV